MHKYLTIHTRYADVQIGFFINGQLQDYVEQSSKKVSKEFILLINSLLEKSNLKLEDLTFIAAQQGPAPFTTLRVSLASVNGLAFATGLPLVGVNGLETFLQEHKSCEYQTIALLNAFCEDIYYGIYNINNTINNVITGCSKYYTFLEHLKEKVKSDNIKKIKFIGNGVNLYKDQIKEALQDIAIIPEDLPELATLEAIGFYAYKNWQNKETTNQLMPLYLKAHTAQLAKKPLEKYYKL